MHPHLKTSQKLETFTPSALQAKAFSYCYKWARETFPDEQNPHTWMLMTSTQGWMIELGRWFCIQVRERNILEPRVIGEGAFHTWPWRKICVMQGMQGCSQLKKKKRKKAQPKRWELRFGADLRTNPRTRILRWPLGTAQKRQILQQRQGGQNIEILLFIRESKINGLCAFLYLGRGKSLSSVKSFLWYIPQFPVSCAFCSWVSSGLTLGDCSDWGLGGGHPVSIHSP